MKYLSLFSGIGGFELGIGDRAECIDFSKTDKYATQVYKKHFPNHKNYGDITKIDAKGLPEFDLLVGGFPCQSFSIAGNRGGFNDTRGTLFFEIARIVKEKQPRLLLLENVKGLLSHDKGATFFTIISTLDELGYDCQWQVLNSKNFGVPQNRERVFIIGHLRGTSRPEVFPIAEASSEADAKIINPLKGKTDYGWHLEQNIYDKASISRTLKAGGGSGNMPKIIQVNNPVHSNNRVYSQEGVSPTLNTMQGGNRQPKIAIPVLTPDRANKRQNGRRFKTDGEPSFTLTTQDKHGVYDGISIRRLTPVECERLQGFPDNWTEDISDTQRYKCLGNAVTVNVIDYICEKLLNN